MVETFRTSIAPLGPAGADRTVRVYLPPGHDAAARHPVLYMLDGQNLFDDADATFGRAWRLGAHLDAHGPAVIVVGLDSPRDERRSDEYMPWPSARAVARHGPDAPGVGGRGHALLDWVAHELKPAIDARYRTDPDATALAGASLGGLMAIYGACAFPAVFRRAAAVSAAVVANEAELVAYLEGRDLSGIERLYVDVGTEEWPDAAENADYLRACRSVAALLAGRVGRFHFAVVDGGTHHESSWGARLSEVLGFLYGD
jgi:predicted alpha/beta superfamily hydrolase